MSDKDPQSSKDDLKTQTGSLRAPEKGKSPFREEVYKAVDWEEHRTLFAKRIKISPKRITGTFRTIKWWFMGVLLSIYYIVPWIRWDRGPFAPDQAVLIDLPARRFHFFMIDIWPQEVYYVTGLLFMAAIGLFLVTSLLGRVWCAWGCPQTVWTDLYMLVERWVEGDRNKRIKLDKAPWTFDKIQKRVVKHFIWIVIAMLTGGAWVFYFMDAPTLANQLMTNSAPDAAYITIGFLTFSTYLMAGHAREQVCTYMCPYSRFQSVMMDDETHIITYDVGRGEPRQKYKQGDSMEDRGHCIRCTKCVAVCPMGIDIRNGLQIECINCGLCADACDDTMKKLGWPTGLVGLESYSNWQRRKNGQPSKTGLIRPRTLIYAGALLLVWSIMVYSLFTRSQYDLNVLKDRNPVFVLLSNGDIRNGYTVKVLNMTHDPREFEVTLEGLNEAQMIVVGEETPSQSYNVNVGPDEVGDFKIFLSLPKSEIGGPSRDFNFVLEEKSTGEKVVHKTTFKGPE